MFAPKIKEAEKTDGDAILKHINSFHQQISHNRRKHAPNRRYLESHLSIRNMWRDFCESKKEVAYETYQKIFEKQKITFGQQVNYVLGLACSIPKEFICETKKEQAKLFMPKESAKIVI